MAQGCQPWDQAPVPLKTKHKQKQEPHCYEFKVRPRVSSPLSVSGSQEISFPACPWWWLNCCWKDQIQSTQPLSCLSPHFSC
jgi:hypothetical protein